MRGKPCPRLLVRVVMGLIPACAGKTSIIHAMTPGASAHPRVCGENFKRLFLHLKKRGSSPRVRGKPGHEADTVQHVGLIPACAGKTRQGSLYAASLGAHPRVCGENSKTGDPRSSELGSSPRVRGKPFGWAFPGWQKGLIPACAGKTAAEVHS